MSQNFYLTVYYISEVFHTAFLIWFAYSLYQILTKKFTPYSNIYVAIYFGSHAVYNGCPLSTFQNLLSYRAGIGVIDNTFLRTELGVWNLPLRFLSLAFTLVLFYNSYKMFQKLEIKPKYWLHFWLESKFYQSQIPTNVIFDVEQCKFVIKKKIS